MPPTVAEASRLPALFIKKSKTTNKKTSILPPSTQISVQVQNMGNTQASVSPR